jgi:hypothetical protein
VALITLDVTPDDEQSDANGAVIITGEVNAVLSATDDLVVVVGLIAAGLTDVITTTWTVAVGPPVQTGHASVPIQVEIALLALRAFGAPPWTMTLQGDVVGAATATYEANSCHLRVGVVERPSPRVITLV